MSMALPIVEKVYLVFSAAAAILPLIIVWLAPYMWAAIATGIGRKYRRRHGRLRARQILMFPLGFTSIRTVLFVLPLFAARLAWRLRCRTSAQTSPALAAVSA